MITLKEFLLTVNGEFVKLLLEGDNSTSGYINYLSDEVPPQFEKYLNYNVIGIGVGKGDEGETFLEVYLC